jgi:hypothetical protein
MRRELRACVASALILTLLGLGGIDAALCRGSDGHFGFDTRVSSCCPSPVPPEVHSSDSVDWNQASMDLLIPGMDGGSNCEHIPLIQATPAAYHDGLVAACDGEPVSILCSSVASEPTNDADPVFCSDWILCRLRSTTLLI